jgi:hypothetical protein
MPAEKMTAELEQTFFSFVLSNHLLPLLFFTLFPDDAVPSDQRGKNAGCFFAGQLQERKCNVTNDI